MKRITTLLLAVLMITGIVFSFSGCNSGEDLKFGKELVRATSQLEALNGLKKGDADIAIIDSVMAGYYMNSSDEFKDYQILDKVTLVEEQYGIAAKKGNDALISKINEALIDLSEKDCKGIAGKYGLVSELLVNASTVNPNASATDNSWNEVVKSGTLTIGYTVFAPIAYEDESGKLIGFDIDLANTVVYYLNSKYDVDIKVEFLEIDWDAKESLLNTGSIDLVWNGMTITKERTEQMSVSIPYLANKQVAIAEKADASKYNKPYADFIKAVNDAIITVEKGSAGESQVLPYEK